MFGGRQADRAADPGEKGKHSSSSSERSVAHLFAAGNFKQGQRKRRVPTQPKFIFECFIILFRDMRHSSKLIQCTVNFSDATYVSSSDALRNEMNLVSHHQSESDMELAAGLLFMLLSPLPASLPLPAPLPLPASDLDLFFSPPSPPPPPPPPLSEIEKI